jgi:hypothetical protein
MPVQTRSMIKQAKEQEAKEKQAKEQRKMELIREELRKQRIMDLEQQQAKYLVKVRVEEIKQKSYLTKDDVEFIRINVLDYYSLFNETHIQLRSIIQSLLRKMTDLNEKLMYHNIPDILIQIYQQTEKYIIIAHFSSQLDDKIETMVTTTIDKINELKPVIKDHPNIIQKDKIRILEEFHRFLEAIGYAFPDLILTN